MVPNKGLQQKVIYITDSTVEILIEIVKDVVRIKIKNVVQSSKSCNVRINRQGF